VEEKDVLVDVAHLKDVNPAQLNVVNVAHLKEVNAVPLKNVIVVHQ